MSTTVVSRRKAAPRPWCEWFARVIDPTSLPCATEPARRRIDCDPACTPRHLLLAAPMLLAMVLASQPVYAQAPPAPAAGETTARPPVQKSTPKPTATTARESTTAAPPSTAGKPSSTSTADKADAATPGAAKPAADKTRATQPGAAQPGAAQPGAPKPGAAEAAASGARPERSSPVKARAEAAAAKRGGRKAISIDDDFLVEGKLEKPNAFFILRRSQADFDWARLGATFSPLVLESVQDPLF